MRVRGNANPTTVTVEEYSEYKCEVRIRENVMDISFTDEMTGKHVEMYEYDEYTMITNKKEGLLEEIEENIRDWIDAGREAEARKDSSIVKELKEALYVLGVEA